MSFNGPGASFPILRKSSSAASALTLKQKTLAGNIFPFAPQLPKRVPVCKRHDGCVLTADKTPAWALTIHGSANARETEGLRAVLSNFSRGGRAFARVLSTPSTPPNATSELYCSLNR